MIDGHSAPANSWPPKSYNREPRPLFLLLGLSLFIGPHAALAVTTPALLLGNVHRAWLCRSEVNWGIARRVMVGAIPGSLLGGFYAGLAPAWSLNILLVGITGLAVAKASGLLTLASPRHALAPMGALIGALTGTSGGAGVLVAPLLLSAGLSGVAYVGTSAVVAVSIHAGRLVAYGHTGAFHPDMTMGIAILVVSIFGGNFAGDRIRPILTRAATTRLEYATLVVCVALAVSGVAG